VILVTSTTKLHYIYRAIRDGRANWGLGLVCVIGHEKNQK
jgi:hypothetical protein